MKYITQQVVPPSTRRTRKRTKSQPYLQGKGNQHTEHKKHRKK